MPATALRPTVRTVRYAKKIMVLRNVEKPGTSDQGSPQRMGSEVVSRVQAKWSREIVWFTICGR